MVSELLRSPSKDLRKLLHGLSVMNQRTTSMLTGCRRSSSLNFIDDHSKDSLLQQESSSGDSKKVPRGYLAVYVGPEATRYVIPARYLSLPDFRVLMENVAEEFGFEQEGALKFPCEKEEFEEILIRCYTKHDRGRNKMKKKDRNRSLTIVV